VPNPPYETGKRKRQGEGDWVSTMRDSTGGWQRCSSTCPLPWKRTYVRTSNFLRSILTANVPAGIEFEYARTNQGEYLAIVALAVSNPEFLHRTLPRAQSNG